MSTLRQRLIETSKDIDTRFVDRQGSDERSNGKLNITRTGENAASVYREDWFHTFASLPTKVVVISILCAYMVSIMFWALLFYIFRAYGFIDIHCYLNALIISLETITTVGYTVTDISFHDEPIAFCLLFGEMMQSVLMNSFCIGVVYARLSRALTRTRSIIFSKKAVIREINGEWYFLFQVCERRKHQLIESHVSCYSVQHTVNTLSGIPFMMKHMKLDHPDDKLGGKLLLILPAVVIHHIDADSPLYPFIHHTIDDSNMNYCMQETNGVYFICQQCGQCFTAQSLLAEHVEVMHHVKDDKNISTEKISKVSISDYLIGNDIEIVVFIEGTESVTSNSLQARYSYRAQDIEYNMTFHPCVSVNDKKQAVIDFNQFQELVSLDREENYHEDLYMQTII